MRSGGLDCAGNFLQQHPELERRRRRQHEHDGQLGSANRREGHPSPRCDDQSRHGGTLKIVGNGDVDHLDTCCAYYTTTYELLRAVSRQLVSYPSAHNDPAPTTPVPDMATYSVSPNGLTYTFKIKQGVMWDAPSGARQVTSQDEVLGLKRLCNPVLPGSAARLLGEQHRRHEVVLHGFRGDQAAEQPVCGDRGAQELHRQQPDKRAVDAELVDAS